MARYLPGPWIRVHRPRFEPRRFPVTRPITLIINGSSSPLLSGRTTDKINRHHACAPGMSQMHYDHGRNLLSYSIDFRLL